MHRAFSIVVTALALVAAPAFAQPVQPGPGSPPPPAAGTPGAEPEFELPPPPPPDLPPPPPPAGLQNAPADGGAAEDRPAQGFVLQATVPTQALAAVASLFSSGMLVGYRSDRLVIGARVGLDVASVSLDSTETATLTLVSVSPTLEYYLWQSRDGRVLLDLLASVGFGWAGITDESTSTMPPSSSDASALFLPLAVGVGADFFLHRNFALGLEAGYQGAVLLSSQSNGRSGELGLSLHGLYGALRLTAVIGD